MKVLLLGGSGFVSGAVLEALVACEVEVTAVTRGITAGAFAGARRIQADRTDGSSIRAALPERYDVVVDVSGYTSRDVDVVLDALPSTPDSYVFVSSAAVYDSRRTALPFGGDRGLGGDPIWGEYGSDKSQAEALLRRRLPGRVHIVRPPYVYGPGNNLPRESFLWARMLGGHPVYIPADGRTLVQFCHVRVLAGAIAQMATSGEIPPGAYNVAEERYYSFDRYLDVLADVTGVSSFERRYVGGEVPARDYFPFRDSHLLLDIDRWRASASYVDVGLADGLADTLAACRAAGDLEFHPTPYELAHPA